MTGWLIYRKKDVEKNKRYINFYIEEGSRIGIQIKLILVENLYFAIKDNKLFMDYNGEKIDKPDFAINRSIYPLLSKHLEDMAIKVYNNSKVAEICNDKGRTHQYLARYGIAMVDTRFLKGDMLHEAFNRIKEATVIKGVSGHGGNQVFLYDPRKSSNKQKERIISKLKDTDVVIQPLIGKQDLRVYVIGDKIIAGILRTAKSGFKSNYSLGGEVREYLLSREEKNLIKDIIKAFDFGLVGIDFLIQEDGSLLFNEIEDVVGARMLYQCTDINIVGLYLNHIRDELLR